MQETVNVSQFKQACGINLESMQQMQNNRRYVRIKATVKKQ